MSRKILKKDVVAYFGTMAEVARAFDPPLTRQAVNRWPEHVPELRARQLIEKIPDLQLFLSDPARWRDRALARLSARCG